MRYLCPKCGETYTLRPANGTCLICDATVVAQPEAQEAEQHGDRGGMPSPKKRL